MGSKDLTCGIAQFSLDLTNPNTMIMIMIMHSKIEPPDVYLPSMELFGKPFMKEQPALRV